MNKFFFLACAAVTSLAISATQYCQTPITSVDGTATINLTCEKIAEGNYSLVVEGENLNGFGGSFYNPGAVDLRNSIVSSTATKIECSIVAVSDPVLYTPLYVLMPGEKVFNWPNDIEWGRCGGGVEDSEAPVLTSATLVSHNHNSAVIAVEATDNVGVRFYEVKNGETVLGNIAAVDGQITVKGLTPATAYTLTIVAVDAAGNKSAEKTVSFTTDSFNYCEVALGHLGDANFGDPNGRCILTLTKKNETTVMVTLTPNFANGANKNLDFLYVDPKFGAPITTGADIDAGDGVTSLSVDVVYADAIPATMNFTIQWSQPAWGGRWSMDVLNVAIAELCPEETTTLMNGASANKSIIKRFVNGQLILSVDGIDYNAQGQVVK